MDNETLLKEIKQTNDITELYRIGGILNNRPNLINQDHVTIMAFMTIDQAKTHLIDLIERK